MELKDRWIHVKFQWKGKKSFNKKFHLRSIIKGRVDDVRQS